MAAHPASMQSAGSPLSPTNALPTAASSAPSTASVPVINGSTAKESPKSCPFDKLTGETKQFIVLHLLALEGPRSIRGFVLASKDMHALWTEVMQQPRGLATYLTTRCRGPADLILQQLFHNPGLHRFIFPPGPDDTPARNARRLHRMALLLLPKPAPAATQAAAQAAKAALEERAAELAVRAAAAAREGEIVSALFRMSPGCCGVQQASELLAAAAVVGDAGVARALLEDGGAVVGSGLLGLWNPVTALAAGREQLVEALLRHGLLDVMSEGSKQALVGLAFKQCNEGVITLIVGPTLPHGVAHTLDAVRCAAASGDAGELEHLLASLVRGAAAWPGAAANVLSSAFSEALFLAAEKGHLQAAVHLVHTAGARPSLAWLRISSVDTIRTFRQAGVDFAQYPDGRAHLRNVMMNNMREDAQALLQAGSWHAGQHLRGLLRDAARMGKAWALEMILATPGAVDAEDCLFAAEGAAEAGRRGLAELLLRGAERLAVEAVVAPEDAAGLV